MLPGKFLLDLGRYLILKRFFRVKHFRNFFKEKGNIPFFHLKIIQNKIIRFIYFIAIILFVGKTGSMYLKIDLCIITVSIFLFVS